MHVLTEYTPRMKTILDAPFPSDNSHDTYRSKLLNVQLKTVCLMLFGLLYKQLSVQKIKAEVHTHLYGPKTEGNELTKHLITIAHEIKSSPKKQLQKELYQHMDYFDINECVMREIIRDYFSEAYNCLAQVLMRTQTKEHLFVQYLFNSRRDKGEELWTVLFGGHLLDSDFRFEVLTNFKLREQTDTFYAYMLNAQRANES